MRKTIIGVLAIGLIGAQGVSANWFSGATAAPLNQQSSVKLQQAIDEPKQVAILGACDRRNSEPCMLRHVKEMKATFERAGFSFDLSLRNSYANRQNAIHTSQLGWGDLYMTTFYFLKTPEGQAKLLAENLVTQETVDVINKLIQSQKK
ncbi:MAG: hypothetical protein CMH98_03690 [Oceanospirillaceae bacterium]|nr:hypothetical protein [Oceanospirillaceae bacterium]